MRKIIGILLLLSFGLILIFLVYSGFFNDVDVREVTSPSYVLVYQKAKGSYDKSLRVVSKVRNILMNNGIYAYRGFGFYFDDPDTVQEKDRRYIAGCILDADTEEALDKVRDRLRIRSFGPEKCLMSSFPYENRLNVLAGAVIVYSEFKEYTHNKEYAPNGIMEIYDNKNRRIIYYMPVMQGISPLEKYY